MPLPLLCTCVDDTLLPLLAAPDPRGGSGTPAPGAGGRHKLRCACADGTGACPPPSLLWSSGSRCLVRPCRRARAFRFRATGGARCGCCVPRRRPATCERVYCSHSSHLSARKCEAPATSSGVLEFFYPNMHVLKLKNTVQRPVQIQIHSKRIQRTAVLQTSPLETKKLQTSP